MREDEDDGEVEREVKVFRFLFNIYVRPNGSIDDF